MSTSEKIKFRNTQKRREAEFIEDASDGGSRLPDIIPFFRSAIERIDSSIPTCNTDIKKVKNEHIMIENLYNKFKEPLSLKVDNYFYKLFNNELDTSVSNAENFFKVIFGKVKIKKIRETKLNNLTLRRLTGRLQIDDDKVTVIAEYSSYGKFMDKACIILSVPFNKSPRPVRSDFVRASNYHCSYYNRETGKLKSSDFWRAYDNKKKLRSSLEGYYGLLDREAYMYRMVPDTCKWY